MDIKPYFPNSKADLDRLQQVYDFIEKYPGTPTSQIKKILHLNTNAYNYILKLKAVGLVNGNNLPTSLPTETHWVVPDPISKGENFGHKYANWAGYLSRFSDNEKIPGLSLTKKEVLIKLRANIIDEYTDIEDYKKKLFIFQELLGVGAIMTGNLKAFENLKDPTPVGKNEL